MQNKKFTVNRLMILMTKTVICYTVFFIFLFTVPIYKQAKSVFSNYVDRTNVSYVVIGQATVSAAIADSNEERVAGLSGRKELRYGNALLFVFDEPGRHEIWMKDMNFAIDIIWLDHTMQVIYIERNISPDTFPKIYLPETPAKYVLEVPAGFVKKEGIKIGDQMSLL